MSGRRRPGAPFLAAAAVLLIVGGIFLRQDLGGRSSPPPVAGPGTPVSHPSESDQSALQARLDAVSAAVDAIAARQDPVFDLNELQTDGSGRFTGTLVVYRADADPGRLAGTYAPAARTGVRLAFARALLSGAQQAHLSRLVAAQRAAFAARGIVLTTWGGEDRPGGRFEICYDPHHAEPTPQLLTRFQEYGADTVVFRASEVAAADGSARGPRGGTPGVGAW